LAQVLLRLVQNAGRNVLVEQLGEGVEADLFMVRSRDGEPIWATHRSLVIKLYKPAAALDPAVAHNESNALAHMNAILDGITFDGWRISTPLPLLLCESPLAFVMTLVPGRRLESCLGTSDNMTDEALETMPPAIVAAMKRYWSLGQLHGDLHIENILCDLPARHLSFIDAGTPVGSFVFCNDIARTWYPASHDLGYMLFNTSIRVRSNLGHSAARLREQDLVERILRIFVETVGPLGSRRELVDEIGTCARAHLKSLELTCSPSGLWHALLRQAASRYIDRVINTLIIADRNSHRAASEGRD
jgi:hypothetical protein